MSVPASERVNYELNIFYLCDCSGSMSGGRIAAVNAAIAKTLPELVQFSAYFPHIAFNFGAIRFSNEAGWHVPAGSPIAAVQWQPIIDTGGVTSLGLAYTLLTVRLKWLESKPGQLPPVILLFSDGMPTDDAAMALDDLLSCGLGGGALRFAIGIGDDVDRDILSRLVGKGQQARMAVVNSAVSLRDVVSSFTLGGVRSVVSRAVDLS